MVKQDGQHEQDPPQDESQHDSAGGADVHPMKASGVTHPATRLSLVIFFPGPSSAFTGSWPRNARGAQVAAGRSGQRLPGVEGCVCHKVPRAATIYRGRRTVGGSSDLKNVMMPETSARRGAASHYVRVGHPRARRWTRTAAGEGAVALRSPRRP